MNVAMRLDRRILELYPDFSRSRIEGLVKAGFVSVNGDTAAKAGLAGAAKSLAIELARRSITVNCVAPGIIDTEMADAIPRDILKLAVPMQRAGTAAEVAETVKFLMSDGASYITRQVIQVNGGLA